MLAFKKYDTANADDEQSRKASILSSLRRLELEFRMSYMLTRNIEGFRKTCRHQGVMYTVTKKIDLFSNRHHYSDHSCRAGHC